MKRNEPGGTKWRVARTKPSPEPETAINAVIYPIDSSPGGIGSLQ
jgi:hypothetical protein